VCCYEAIPGKCTVRLMVFLGGKYPEKRLGFLVSVGLGSLGGQYVEYLCIGVLLPMGTIGVRGSRAVPTKFES